MLLGGWKRRSKTLLTASLETLPLADRGLGVVALGHASAEVGFRVET